MPGATGNCSCNDSEVGSNVSVDTVTYDKYASNFQPWGDYLYGIVLILIGAASIIGNSLAIHVFRRKGRDITIPESLLLNIAMMDLFLAVASHPASIVAAFAHRWIFGEIGCMVYAGVCFFLGLATIFSLTTLAVFRFLRTCYPDSIRWMTASRTKSCVIPAIYSYSFFWTMLPFLGISSYDVEPFGLSCSLAWKNPDNVGKMYIVSVSVCCALLPAMAIIGSHAGILFRIRRAGETVLNKETTSKQSSKAELQFIRVSFAVCLGFVFAWMPYTVFCVWSTFGDSSIMPMWMTPIPVLLAKSSIAYNPVIYVLLTRRYRVDFTRALRELMHLSGPREDISDTAKTLPLYRRTPTVFVTEQETTLGCGEPRVSRGGNSAIHSSDSEEAETRETELVISAVIECKMGD